MHRHLFKDVKLQEFAGFSTLIAVNLFVKDRLKLNEYEEGALLLYSRLTLGLVHPHYYVGCETGSAGHGRSEARSGIVVLLSNTRSNVPQYSHCGQ